MLIGLAHGLLITRLDMQPFIVTLCGLLIYRGVARFYTADAHRGLRLRPELPLARMADHRAHASGVPHSFIAMLVVAAVMWVVLHRSVFGRYLYAVGKNEEAARYAGVADRAGSSSRPT